MEQRYPPGEPAKWPWRIVAYGPNGDLRRYDVLRGERRVAWGLRDEAAARRWVQRLTPATHGTHTGDGFTPASAG
jgi:hypothetical protein